MTQSSPLAEAPSIHLRRLVRTDQFACTLLSTRYVSPLNAGVAWISDTWPLVWMARAAATGKYPGTVWRIDIPCARRIEPSGHGLVDQRTERCFICYGP